jgi:hypothetical protein
LTALSLPKLEAVIKELPYLGDVHAEGRTVTFQFNGKGQPKGAVMLHGLNDERLSARIVRPLAEGQILAGLLAANRWNQRKQSHDTFAYVQGLGVQKAALVLSAHLLLQGGVTADNLRAWARNFLRRKDAFEALIRSTLKAVGEDQRLRSSA